MAIQMAAPAEFRFSFRHYDEWGEDLGPIDLSLAEHDPIKVRFEKPSGATIEILEAQMTVTDSVNGLAKWTAAPGQLDQRGRWGIQAWVGYWPSRLRAFTVLGPNI
jgi:hypothetical protein